MNRPFALDDRAVGMLLALARVALDHVQTFDDDALFFCQHGDDFAALALFLSGQHDHFIAFFNMKLQKILK